MKPIFWRGLLFSVAAWAVPFAAGAQTESCDTALSNAAYAADVSPEAARMRCDLERAGTIRARAAELYGSMPLSLVEIVDTASPSGAAYVYDVSNDGQKLRLDARSVPAGRGPRCRLQAALPDDTASSLTALVGGAGDPALPDYGPREEVTINPDGSRSLRLVFDSHDIVTRAETASGPRIFSRHAGSDDPVSRLNSLVIGFANISSGWTCTAVF